MSHSLTPPAPRGGHVRTDRPLVPSEAIRLARNASAGTGTDFRSLLASSLRESHFETGAHNRRSSAAGAYQFTDRTWLDLVRRHGAQLGHADAAAEITEKNGVPTVADKGTRQRILALRSDSQFAGALAARYFDENRAHLAKSLGAAPTENEVSMAYFLGPSGATRLIKAAQTTPTIPAADVVPGAVRHNPGLFHNRDGSVKTASEAVASLNKHFDAAARRIDGAVGTNVSMLEPSDDEAG